MEKTVTPPTSKGVMISLILIVYSFILYFLDLNNPGLQFVSYLIFMAGIIWAIISFGKQTDHTGKFGTYFAHGFKTSAVVTILMIIFMLVFVFAFPEFKEKAMEQAAREMEKQPNMTEEMKEQALSMTQKFFTTFLIGGTMFWYIFLGVIASLIGAGVTRKNQLPVDTIEVENL